MVGVEMISGGPIDDSFGLDVRVVGMDVLIVWS